MTSLNLQMARTIGLCFLVALMEGLDLQAAGIAAQGMAAAFELDKLQMSWVFSAGIFGLLPGAFAGGWLADRIGRKRVLMASVGLFGVFSLATALAWDFNSLLVARCITGVGLGAACSVSLAPNSALKPTAFGGGLPWPLASQQERMCSVSFSLLCSPLAFGRAMKNTNLNAQHSNFKKLIFQVVLPGEPEALI